MGDEGLVVFDVELVVVAGVPVLAFVLLTSTVAVCTIDPEPFEAGVVGEPPLACVPADVGCPTLVACTYP
ncbi:MAG: hypothetical protein R3E87_22140 [Burkholderiaceae bacterium]